MKVPGHTSLGYRKDGTYRCQCGAVISSPGLLPDGTVAVSALKDQWNQHKKEFTK